MLIKGGQVQTDLFVRVDDEGPLPDSATIVSLKRFLAGPDSLLGRAYPLGVRLAGGDDPASIGVDLKRLALVELHVGYFRDGRTFSWARMLRTRLAFRGEIRVSGHFLIDQVAFFTRVGVDAFDFADAVSPETIAASVREISHVYQRSVDHQSTIAELRARHRAHASAS